MAIQNRDILTYTRKLPYTAFVFSPSPFYRPKHKAPTGSLCSTIWKRKLSIRSVLAYANINGVF